MVVNAANRYMQILSIKTEFGLTIHFFFFLPKLYFAQYLNCCRLNHMIYIRIICRFSGKLWCIFKLLISKEKIPRKCGCGWKKIKLWGDCTSTWEKRSVVVVAWCNLALPRYQSANGPNIAEAEQKEREEKEERDVDKPPRSELRSTPKNGVEPKGQEPEEPTSKEQDQVAKGQRGQGVEKTGHVGSFRRRQVASWMSPKKNCKSTSALSTMTQQGTNP